MAWIDRPVAADPGPPGGFGVFDPGISALSIANTILPQDLIVDSGTIAVPADRASSIAAQIAMRLTCNSPVNLDLDFLQIGPRSWDITLETDDGTLRLAKTASGCSWAGLTKCSA